MDVIFAAGGESRPGDPLYPLTQGHPKALLPLAGKPMAQWVLDALDASPNVGRIIVMGLAPSDGLQCQNKPLDYIPSQGTIVENARAGLRRVQALNPQATHALWVSSDIPLLQPTHIDWVVDQASTGDDFFYNVIERQLMERRFPASRRTYTHLKDKVVCGGDMNVLATHLAVGDNPLWEKIAQARKNVFQQAFLIGLDTLFWLALRQVTLAQAEVIASQRLGLKGRALLCPYPEIGMDVDKPFQYEIAAQTLMGKP